MIDQKEVFNPWDDDLEPKLFYGRRIVDARFMNDALFLDFADGTGITIGDGGQSCCEHRYARSDDEPKDLIGKTLTLIEVKKFEEIGDCDTHEIAFLEVKADDQTFTMQTHNEHNGYYGGFGLRIHEISR